MTAKFAISPDMPPVVGVEARAADGTSRGAAISAAAVVTCKVNRLMGGFLLGMGQHGTRAARACGGGRPRGIHTMVQTNIRRQGCLRR